MYKITQPSQCRAPNDKKVTSDDSLSSADDGWIWVFPPVFMQKTSRTMGSNILKATIQD